MTAGEQSTGPQRAGTKTRPMTGGEYVESLKYGCVAWLYGERAEDVTAHSVFGERRMA